MSTESMGKRIQRLRKERGLTQKQLADAVGVTPQAVSKWETDESCPDAPYTLRINASVSFGNLKLVY
ncbi:MAG: helix-turn-helix transcriptional regulator [Clostridia bacterium]|nr:helix-turn-helix transcriptional regulator [Clostridia bacterium]